MKKQNYKYKRFVSSKIQEIFVDTSRFITLIMHPCCYNSTFTILVAVTYSIVASYFSIQLFGESLSDKNDKIAPDNHQR